MAAAHTAAAGDVDLTGASSGRRRRYPDGSAGALLVRNTFGGVDAGAATGRGRMRMRKYVTAVGVGSVLGLIASRYLFVGSWLSLIPWTIAGLALGAWCARVESLGVGAVYGFFLVFVFMATGYAGSAPLVGRLPAFAVLGLIGAVCGLVLGVLGSFTSTLWERMARPGLHG